MPTITVLCAPKRRLRLGKKRKPFRSGVDIFAAEGTNVLSATEGVVVSVDKTGNGGNIIYVLGSKWRLHYYAHLQCVTTHFGAFVHTGEVVGKVGNTGNAAMTRPHLQKQEERKAIMMALDH